MGGGGHLHRLPDISDQCSGFADAYGSIQGLSGNVHQFLRVFINIADRVGFVQVGMQALGKVISERGRTEYSEWSHRLCRKKRLWCTSVRSRSPFWFSFARFDKVHDPAQMASRRTDVNDISITQLPLIRNSMTNDFVNGPGLNIRKKLSSETRETPTCRLISGTRDS